jgi:uncharacterized protein involved in outer membrane biogenesis
MTIIKRIAFFFLLLLFLLGGTMVFIVWKYEDDLKNVALDSARSAIVTDIEFNENVVLSFWSDFPLVAVEIEDIRIEDSFRTDTLLSVKKAFVQFDLIKLLKNEITIEGIRVADGFLRLRRNASDQWNYRVWKTSDSNDNKAKTDFSIEILTLENIQLDYDDRNVDLNIQFLSEKSRIKGRFTDENQRLGISLNGFMQRLTTNGADRIIDLPLNIAGVLNINSAEKIYTIEMANAILAGSEMVIDAEWRGLEDGTNMQMKVHAGNIEPATLLPHIWPQMPENIRALNLTGRADLIFSLNGPFRLNSGPKLEATIRMRDGGLNFQNTNVSDLNFEGSLHMEDIKRSKAMRLQFDQFKLSTSAGHVEGKGTLTDLTDPYLKISSTGNSKLEELTVVAGVDSELEATGSISWNIEFSGPLGKDFRTTLNELKQMEWSGELSLENSFLKFNAGIPPLESFNANISLSKGKTSVTDCNGKIGHLVFDGNVEVANLKQILTESDYPVRLTGKIHVAELDIAQLPNEWKFESETETSSSRALTIDLRSEFDLIRYHNFSASEVSGNISMQNEQVRVTDIVLNALGGKINAQLDYASSETGYVLQLDGRMRNIDMSRTLAEWDNFGQKSITSDNLRGKASADLSAEIYLDADQQIIRNKMKVDAKVEVVGGELIKFEPLMALSKFIDVEELNRVRFDTLRNQLSISDNRIHIPRMTVASSILNVDVFGEHGFDQEMDYHVNLLLNDLLRRKAKKKETFDGHEIIDEKGKTRLFLWVRGKPGDIKVGFDKREVRKKLKEDFKQEGQTIKQLFKEEFGGSKTEKEETQQVEFRLEDDGVSEQPNSTQQQTPITESKPKKKKGLFSSEPDESESEGGFEIEFDP